MNKAEWLSRDPIAENGGINLYGYVANNPISESDSLGLCPDCSAEQKALDRAIAQRGRDLANEFADEDAISAQKKAITSDEIILASAGITAIVGVGAAFVSLGAAGLAGVAAVLGGVGALTALDAAEATLKALEEALAVAKEQVEADDEEVDEDVDALVACQTGSGSPEPPQS